MDQQVSQNTDGKKRHYGYACCAVGCGVPSLLVLVCLLVVGYVIYDITTDKFGENMATSPIFYTKKGSNYCYFITSPVLGFFEREYLEFTISEQDFLDWGAKNFRDWEPLEIKSLPSLPRSPQPDTTDEGEWKWINRQQGEKLPLSIHRYLSQTEKHEECRRCLIDPTGKTDDACVRFVDDGYYFQISGRNHGGAYILYDRERQRCYYFYSSN